MHSISKVIYMTSVVCWTPCTFLPHSLTYSHTHYAFLTVRYTSLTVSNCTMSESIA